MLRTSGDGLEAGEDQFAEGSVVGVCTRSRRSESPPTCRAMWRAPGTELLTDRAPGVLHDLEVMYSWTCPARCVRGRRAPLSWWDHTVLDELVDPRVQVGAGHMDPFGHGAIEWAAVRLEHLQDVPIDGVERTVAAWDGAGLRRRHLFRRHVPPPPHLERTVS